MLNKRFIDAMTACDSDSLSAIAEELFMEGCVTSIRQTEAQYAMTHVVTSPHHTEEQFDEVLENLNHAISEATQWRVDEDQFVKGLIARILNLEGKLKGIQ